MYDYTHTLSPKYLKDMKCMYIHIYRNLELYIHITIHTKLEVYINVSACMEICDIQKTMADKSLAIPQVMK